MGAEEDLQARIAAALRDAKASDVTEAEKNVSEQQKREIRGASKAARAR